MAFISRPQVSQGRNFLKFKKCQCSHTRDVLTLDINNENQLVTGSVDNVICFWNSFNGVESKKIVIPESIASLYKGENISYVRFPFKSKKDILLIIINNGECYVLETQSEKYFEFNSEIHQGEIDLGNLGQQYKEAGDIRNETESINLSQKEEAGVTESLCHSPGHNNSLKSEDEVSISKHSQTKKPNKVLKEMQKMQSTQKTNPYLMGKIVPFPIIDLQEQYLVSVSENGRGMLHTIKHNSR